MGDGEGVKGTADMLKQAEAGLALFKTDEELELDQGAAQAFKDGEDAKIAALKAEAEALTGKDNKKARAEKGKEAAALERTDKYIDAVRVLKGTQPKNGNFVKAPAAVEAKAVEAPAAAAEPEVAEAADAKDSAKKAKADDKKPKKTESAGLSKAERDELEKIKTQIIDLKKQLKEEGMSGGQMNKDERVVTMVTRMNELKEKESPGSTQKDGKKDGEKKKGKALSADKQAAVDALSQQVEEYRNKLVKDFGYSKKDIAADPDMVELTEKLKQLQK